MTFHLSIATPEEKLFEGEVTSLTVPGKEGSMQILAHHAALLTTLRAGPLSFQEAAQNHLLTITGGLLEVQNNQAILLLDESH